MRNLMIRGFLAGFLAGIPMELLDWLSRDALHFTKALLHDDMSWLIYGHGASGLGETIVAEFTHFFWLGFLGIGLVYLTLMTRGENRYFRGWVFGVIVWLGIMTIGTFFRIPLLWKVAWQTAASNWITASLWGLVTGHLIERLAGKQIEAA